MCRLIILLLIPFSISAKQLTGVVVGVHDGDTFTLLTDAQVTHKIRLRHIDAPELGKPYSQKSRKKLAELVYQQRVIADCHGKSYNRDVCDVMTADGIDVQLEMVKSGLAKPHPKYNKRPDLEKIR